MTSGRFKPRAVQFNQPFNGVAMAAPELAHSLMPAPALGQGAHRRGASF